MAVWSSNPVMAKMVGLPDKLPVSPGPFFDWKAQSRTLGHLRGGLGLDGRVLAFTFVLIVVAGAVVGLVTALQMTRSDLAGTLRDGTRVGSVTAGGRRTAIDPGFRPAGVLTALVTLAPGRRATRVDPMVALRAD